MHINRESRLAFHQGPESASFKEPTPETRQNAEIKSAPDFKKMQEERQVKKSLWQKVESEDRSKEEPKLKMLEKQFKTEGSEERAEALNAWQYYQEEVKTPVLQRVTDLAQALRTGNPQAVEQMRADLQSMLIALKAKNENVASFAFFDITDRMWNTGYTLFSNPQLSELRLVKDDAQGSRSRRNYVTEHMSPERQQQFMENQVKLIQERTGDLGIAIEEHGASSRQVEAIRVEIHEWLLALQEVNQSWGSYGFHKVNDRLWHTGHQLMTNPRLSELELVARASAPNARKNYATQLLNPAERARFITRQEALIQSRSRQLASVLKKNEPQSQAVERIRGELLNWLQAVDEVDHAAGTRAFQDMNDQLRTTSYRATTTPTFSELRITPR